MRSAPGYSRAAVVVPLPTGSNSAGPRRSPVPGSQEHEIPRWLEKSRGPAGGPLQPRASSLATRHMAKGKPHITASSYKPP